METDENPIDQMWSFVRPDLWGYYGSSSTVTAVGTWFGSQVGSIFFATFDASSFAAWYTEYSVFLDMKWLMQSHSLFERA